MTCAAERLKPAAGEPTLRAGHRIEMVGKGGGREGGGTTTAPPDSVAKMKAGARARAEEKKGLRI